MEASPFLQTPYITQTVTQRILETYMHSECPITGFDLLYYPRKRQERQHHVGGTAAAVCRVQGRPRSFGDQHKLR